MADPRDDGLPPVPTGIQRLLRLASVDEAFRAELIARRDSVATPAGIELTASERAVLRAIPAPQLGAMIAGLPPPADDRRAFLRGAAASAVVLLGGAALGGCPGPVGGARPDIPPPPDGGAASPEVPTITAGVRPDQPVRPDSRESAVGGGAAPDRPPARPDDREMMRTGGAAPDRPPPRPPRNETPTEGGAAPDEPPERPTYNEMQGKGGAAPDRRPRDAGVDAPPRPENPPKTRGIRPDIPKDK
jgi:hypothetical protein